MGFHYWWWEGNRDLTMLYQGFPGGADGCGSLRVRRHTGGSGRDYRLPVDMVQTSNANRDSISSRAIEPRLADPRGLVCRLGVSGYPGAGSGIVRTPVPAVNIVLSPRDPRRGVAKFLVPSRRPARPVPGGASQTPGTLRKPQLGRVWEPSAWEYPVGAGTQHTLETPHPGQQACEPLLHVARSDVGLLSVLGYGDFYRAAGIWML